MTDTALDVELEPAAVAAWLGRHPDFLAGWPELAARLTLPRPGGTVATLANWQAATLREKHAELERRLAGLVATAEANERLMQRMHALGVALMRASTLENVARTVHANLSAEFGVEHVRLLLFAGLPALPKAPWLEQDIAGAAALPAFAELLASGQPCTGRLAPARLARLFGAAAEDIRSAALLPLDGHGLLALGSPAAERFQPGLGTAFLAMLGATISAAIARAGDLA